MNPVDYIVNFFNPVAGLERSRARLAGGFIEARSYDINSKGRRNKGWFRPNTTAAQEVSKSNIIGASTGQEMCRNNPLASRIKRVWANNAVGCGITLDVSSELHKGKADLFNTDWDNWAESTDCDYEGHYDLYGLQWLWMSTTVESGGVFIRQHIQPGLKFPLQLQTFEESMLDRSKNSISETGNIVDGIAYDKKGKIKGYWFLVDSTNTFMVKRPVSTFYKANSIIHMFRKERAGQHLGMTWFASLATTLNNYSTYQDAKLMQQQIAACFALFMEEADKSTGIGVGKGTSDLPDSIEPGMIEHIKAGTVPHTISPPKADNASNFDISIKRDIASGAGITYEQLTGDMSKVTFASGRIARLEFYNELDYVQKLMLKPAFNKIFQWFNIIHQIKNGNNDVVPDWTYPVRAGVNPKEELDVLMSKVRHGMLSPKKAAKQLGEKLDKIVEQWKKDKELFGDLPFDIDPSVFARTGNQLDEDDAASENNKDKNEEDEEDRVFNDFAIQLTRELADVNPE